MQLQKCQFYTPFNAAHVSDLLLKHFLYLAPVLKVHYATFLRAVNKKDVLLDVL